MSMIISQKVESPFHIIKIFNNITLMLSHAFIEISPFIEYRPTNTSFL